MRLGEVHQQGSGQHDHHRCDSPHHCWTPDVSFPATPKRYRPALLVHIEHPGKDGDLANTRPCMARVMNQKAVFTRSSDRVSLSETRSHPVAPWAFPVSRAPHTVARTALRAHLSHEPYAHDRLPSAFMVAGSVLRADRPVPRAGAALVVLLAALIHLLGCAHGPTPTGIGRADSLLATTASWARASTPADDASERSAPRPGENREHCWGGDVPTVQPPRDIASPVPAAHSVPASAADTGMLGPAKPGPPPGSAQRPARPGRARARLGVWRT